MYCLLMYFFFLLTLRVFFAVLFSFIKKITLCNNVADN
jgi:hypothetical protein